MLAYPLSPPPLPPPGVPGGRPADPPNPGSRASGPPKSSPTRLGVNIRTGRPLADPLAPSHSPPPPFFTVVWALPWRPLVFFWSGAPAPPLVCTLRPCQTPLHYSAESGAREAIDSLVKGRASINAPDNRDKTPLMHAAEAGDADVLEHLVRHGAGMQCKAKVCAFGSTSTADPRLIGT